MILKEFILKSKKKVTDITTIKDLNLWGAGLKDISILKNLRRLEVLSLSENNIESLEPLRHCLKLKELHLRKNLISDVDQISYLRGLPDLASLVLSENPFGESLGHKYRPTVLRYLPQLKMLDEKEVTPEELQQATSPESSHVADEAEKLNNFALDTSIPYLNFQILVDNNDEELGTAFSPHNFEEIDGTVCSEFDISALASADLDSNDSSACSLVPALDTADLDSNYSTACSHCSFGTVEETFANEAHNSENSTSFQSDMLNCALCIVRLLNHSNKRVVQSIVRVRMQD